MSPIAVCGPIPRTAVVKNPLTTETMTKRIYMVRIPGTGYFLRCPRWIYNRWPWAGIVHMWDVNPKVSEEEKARWWRSGWSRKYRRIGVIGGSVFVRLVRADCRWQQSKATKGPIT